MNCTEKRFLEDVKNHQIEIIRDEEINRHLRFKQPDTIAYYFDLITWLGHLCITGDCGTYVFTRVPDMFEFFRYNEKYKKIYPDKKLFINPKYWSEKLLSIDKVGKCEEFDTNIFEERIKEYFNKWEFENEKQKKEVWDAIEYQVLNLSHDGEIRAYDAVMGFNSGYGHEFCDFWEVVDCKSYTFRFLWCLYAIVWGIEIYDGSKNIKF